MKRMARREHGYDLSNGRGHRGQSSDPLTACLTGVCTYKRWSQIAEKDYSFAASDVRHLAAALQTQSSQGSYFQQRLAGLGRRSLRYKSKHGRQLIVTSLGQGQFLTRSVKAVQGAFTFAVVDEARPDHVTRLFEWHVDSACAAHFEHYVSHDSNFVLITGPRDTMDRLADIPSTRMLCRLGAHTFQTFHLKLKLSVATGDRVWPLTAAFCPLPGHQEALFALICSQQNSAHLPRDTSNGVLALYDANAKHFVHACTDHQVASSVLKFVCGGERLLVADEDCDYPVYRHLLVFATHDLTLLQRVPVLPTCSVSNPALLYSIDFSRLALLLMRKKPKATAHAPYLQWDDQADMTETDENGNYVKSHVVRQTSMEKIVMCKQYQVAVYKVKLQDADLNLARMCCIKICSQIRDRDPDLLPLPGPLITMVRGFTHRL